MISSKVCRLLIGRNLQRTTKIVSILRYKHDFGFYRKPWPYNVERYLDLNNQSVLLPGPERIRASKLIDNPEEVLSTLPDDDIITTYDVLNSGLRNSNDGDCLGVRTNTPGVYKWIKYSEVIQRSQYVGSALLHMGLQSHKECLVGIIAANRVEFALTLWACAGYSLVCVPIYDALGVDNINFIIKQAKFPFVISNTNKHALDILKSISQFPLLKTLILMDPPSPEVTSSAEASKIKLITFSEFEKLGEANRKPLSKGELHELFAIPYTSGTTGVPKGVMLTHKNIVSVVAALRVAYGPVGVFGGTFMSYFPPAHVYEIINEVVSMYFARRVAFYSGDIRKLFDEMSVLRPTHLPMVPRLLNAFYAKVMAGVESSKLKSFLVNLAMSRKENMVKRGKVNKDTIWDKLILKKIQDALGGNVFGSVTTSAPISRDVIRFFRCAAGCYMFEAYGQTEVLGAVMTYPFEIEGGFVGPPLPCCHIKLVDVPEMKYYSKNDEGEICIKGANVFKGYFMNPEATKEAIDENGWHHSGDIGRWLPNGTLQVIDRKKHIFKLSQGEYIAPEKVENAYSRCCLVAQVFVDGLSEKDYVVAIVVPDESAFLSWSQKHGFNFSKEELIKNKDVRTAFMKELHSHGKASSLTSLEQAKNLRLTLQPLTLEQGLLTPTLKIRRNNARKHFENVFEELYAEGPLVPITK